MASSSSSAAATRTATSMTTVVALALALAALVAPAAVRSQSPQPFTVSALAIADGDVSVRLGRFGTGVAADSGFVAVGAPNTFSGNGSVSVYDCRFTPCIYLQTLVAPLREPFQEPGLPSPNTPAEFGYAVAMRGSLLLVGAPGWESAYLYQCAFGSTCQGPIGDVITAADPFQYLFDRLGSAVVLGDNFAAIGAYNWTSGFDPSEVPTGLVYFYTCNATAGCNNAEQLRPVDSLPNDNFGLKLAQTNGLLAVGAPFAYGNSGSVSVYSCSDGNCLNEPEPATLIGDSNELFGLSVAMSAGLLAVGCNVGNVHLFSCVDIVGVAPVCTSTLNLTGDASTGYGTTVALYLGILAVGAPQAGLVYLYSCSASGTECTFLDAIASGASYDQFGSVLTFASTSTVVVGAPNATMNDLLEVGAVYLGVGYVEPLNTNFPVWGILLVVIGGGGVAVLLIYFVVLFMRRSKGTPAAKQEYATLVDEGASTRYT